MINQLNVSKVTQDVLQLLTDADQVGKLGVGLSRSDDIPGDPPTNGWVGVFKSQIRYPLRTAGAGQAGRNHIIELIFAFVQTGRDGPTCEDALELLIKNTMDVILNDGSFVGNVDMLNEDIVIRYTEFTQNGTHYRQVAYAFVSGIKRV